MEKILSCVARADGVLRHINCFSRCLPNFSRAQADGWHCNHPNYPSPAVKKYCLFLLIASLLAPLHAAPMRLDATFSGEAVDAGGSGASYALSGSLYYLFDSDWVGSVGNFSLVDQAPTSLSLNPGSTGNTIFDESNTSLTLNFWNGSIAGVNINGLTPGVSAGQDDFLVVMFGPGSFAGGFLMHTLESSPAYFGMDFTITGSFGVVSAPVPEAGSTVLLSALAMIGLLVSRRRSA